MDKKWWILLIILIVLAGFIFFIKDAGSIGLSIQDKPSSSNNGILALILIEALIVAILISLIILIVFLVINKIKKRK